MTDDNKQLKTTNITFRFSSGQVLALDEHQIATIPYLAAMVSSADHFHCARDEDGHYKLDPNINHQHFSLILQLLPFHSVRQVFSCLPEEEENVIPIVALLDFLGLLPYSLPSLEEVNSTFFCTLVYSPYREDYLSVLKNDVLEDMGVQFAIAMIKEEYDFDDCGVMDQIYWFVMFILGAYEWFDVRLRKHVYTTARNCFALFKPTFLSLLEQLALVPRMEMRKYSYIWDKENNIYFTSIPYPRTIIADESDKDSLERAFFSFQFRRKRRLRFLNVWQHWIPPIGNIAGQDPLDSIYHRVLEIMWVRLQAEVCQSVSAQLQQRKNQYKVVQKQLDVPASFCSVRRKILAKKIDNIFATQQVQEDIDALILKNICLLIPKLQDEHAKLMKLLREFEEDFGTFDRYTPYMVRWLLRYDFSPGISREKILSYELLLDKLHNNPCDIVEQIRRRILVGLNEAALNHLNQWEGTQREIHMLESQLKQNRQPDLCYHFQKKNNAHQQHPSTTCKPFVNHHFKRSIR